MTMTAPSSMMMVAVALALLLAPGSQALEPLPLTALGVNSAVAGRKAHVTPTRDVVAASARAAAAVAGGKLLYHAGGKVVVNVASTYAFLLGTGWDVINKADQNEVINGVFRFLNQYPGSSLDKQLYQYTAVNGRPTSVGKIQGYFQVNDVSGATFPDPIKNQAPLLAQICRGAASYDAAGNTIVFVLSDQPRNGLPYCGFHGSGTCNGVNVFFSFQFNLNGDAGCATPDTSAATGHSQWLAATVNVMSHELAEIRTDAFLNAWYDIKGNENGDKCAYVFGPPYIAFPDGSLWTVQTEWSNSAFASKTGYANSFGELGCAIQ